MKPKHCNMCNIEYLPISRSQRACSPKCALRLVKADLALATRKKYRRAKKELNQKDRTYLTKKAQQAFNLFIRNRDKGNPCISCGRLTGCKLNAGHYRSSGEYPALKFEPDNCHSQCEHCNSYKGGNLAQYRINLIDKIGEKRVNWLEGSHPHKKHSIQELKNVRDYFVKCLKTGE